MQFSVTEEAKTFLKEQEGPLAVITVTGLYRTGKSYLLNRMLLNRKRGFGVGGSVNACTKVSLALISGDLDLVASSSRLLSRRQANQGAHNGHRRHGISG